MGKLEENLEKNEQITGEFKELARETFKEMLDMLGRERFKKWIKLQIISKDVKSLIYEWADFESPFKGGEYNHFKNRVRIQRGISNVKNVIRHENFHFFTRKCPLGTFLQEGCTEYLNFLAEKEDLGYTYEENVEVVRFLREFIGDSIIQTYLTGNTKYYYGELDRILSEKIKIKEERDELIEDFEDNLDNRHYYRYNSLNESNFTLDEEEYDDTIEDKINDFFREIIMCKFAQMAKERTFNRNGKLDEKFAEEIIRNKLKHLKFIGPIYVVQSQDDSDYIINGMLDSIMCEIRVNSNSKMKVINNLEWIETSKILEEDRFTINKAFSFINIFERKEPMSIIEFSDYITKLNTTHDIKKDELREACEKYAFKNFKDQSEASQVYELIIQNISRNNAVFDILANEFTSTESKFRKIGDSEYVEKRDEQFVYIKINDDGTVIQETDLSKVKHIFKIGDNLESIRLINREDDYKELGIFGEQEFQQAEMVHLLLDEILYQKNINLQSIVKKMNLLIDDSKLLSRLTETALQKRTRLQVRSLINVLTKDEIEQVTNDIYDKAILDSGVKDIEHKQEVEKIEKY